MSSIHFIIVFFQGRLSSVSSCRNCFYLL